MTPHVATNRISLILGILVYIATASVGCTSQDRQASRGEGLHTSAASGLTIADSTVMRFEDHQYDRIFDLELDARGYVYVADYDARRIRGFSPSGESTWSVGGEGAAPSEFKWLMDITLYKTDSLYALDYGNMKINVYTLQDGPPTLQRTIPLQRLHGSAPRYIFKPDAVGFLVLYKSAPRPPEDRRQWLARIDYEGRVINPSIISVPADRILREKNEGPGWSLFPKPFRARHLIDVADDRVYTAISSDAEVTRHSLRGEAGTSLTIADPHLAVTDHDLDSLIARRMPGLSERHRSFIESSNIPAHYPVFDGLEVDDRGRIWLDVNSTATDIGDWVVIDPQNRSVKRLNLRPGEEIASVMGPRVAAIRQRPTGAQDIVVYRLSNDSKQRE